MNEKTKQTCISDSLNSGIWTWDIRVAKCLFFTSSVFESTYPNKFSNWHDCIQFWHTLYSKSITFIINYTCTSNVWRHKICNKNRNLQSPVIIKNCLFYKLENDIIITSVRRKTVHFVHIFGICIIPPFCLQNLWRILLLFQKILMTFLQNQKTTPTQIL